jgi:hypothetical protein
MVSDNAPATVADEQQARSKHILLLLGEAED